MCHRYRISLRPEELAEIFEVVRVHWEPTGSDDLFPLSVGPVIRWNDTGERELVALQWGLLPSWWKPSARSKTAKAFQRQCFNARSETAHEKPTYRTAFKQRRCLIPALRFEENRCWLQRSDHNPLVMAGLWESWRNGDENIESYTILTTEPSPLIASAGAQRMPVLLPDAQAQARWLSPDLIERPALEALLRPCEEGLELAPELLSGA